LHRHFDTFAVVSNIPMTSGLDYPQLNMTNRNTLTTQLWRTNGFEPATATAKIVVIPISASRHVMRDWCTALPKPSSLNLLDEIPVGFG
jgi:hypothetical protein